MKGRFDIYRKKPGGEPFRQTFEADVRPGAAILDVFHYIQARVDPSFAYRYSCRGAICGSCAVRVNDVAALACKTRAFPLAEKGVVKIDPLGNMPTVKDLVADHEIFWREFEKARPYLRRGKDEDRHDESLVWEDQMDDKRLDQFARAADCIKCGACFSDCPKRAEDPSFIGPAACAALYKFLVDPRDAQKQWRMELAASDEGAAGCDSHGNCVKVCPKDVRPLRAINFMKRELEE